MIPPFFRVQTKGQTESTNDDAKDAALAGESEGYVIQALKQSSGRGRHGRVWESPEGNLYVSILLRPHAQLQQVTFYSFATAMAVYDAILSIKPDANIQLKWPNDVLIDGKKASGILLEAAPVNEDGTVDWVVIGVGINVSCCPDNAMYPTTSLHKEGIDVDVDQILEAFLKSFDQWHMTLRFDGFRPIRRAWLAYAKLGEMSVRLPDKTIEGEFAGMDEQGGLILRLSDGSERVIVCGDVFYNDKHNDKDEKQCC